MSRKSYVRIYDTDLNVLADLQNAFEISYDQRINEVWQASFSMPADDDKIDHCSILNYAEIYDDTDRIGMFRIIKPKTRHDDKGKIITYECEHVLSTLIDDWLIGVNDAGTGTTTALNYVLNRQIKSNWTLGTVDFSKSFYHRWEDVTLLKALFSIPRDWQVDYQWTFDDSTYPWTINLIEPPTDVTAYIDYGRNLKGIDKEEDATKLVTRLYAYGQGEGANQIKLSDSTLCANEYIDAATMMQTYGTIVGHWEAQDIQNAENLYQSAKDKLNEVKVPKTTYKIDAIDMYQLSQKTQDKFDLGDKIQVKDREIEENVTSHLVSKAKDAMIEEPGDVELQFSNKIEEFEGYGQVAYADDLDGVRTGGAFARVLSTQIDAGKILLSAVDGGQVGTIPTTPSVAGLYIGANFMGYHDGSNWTTYWNASGEFWMKGSAGKIGFVPGSDEWYVENNAGDKIFKYVLGGADEGDVIMGDESSDTYLKWDDSTGQLTVHGSVWGVDGLILEPRTSDPSSPEEGQIWLRTDL